jgi:hypothetical protein
MLAPSSCSTSINSRLAIPAVLILLLVTVPAGQVAAQGLLDFLFERSRSTSPPTTTPPRALAYGDPGRFAVPTKQHAAPTPPATIAPAFAGSVGGPSYCVRLCDGRFFPMHRQAIATQLQICHALCPASQTKIFSGVEIRRAVTTDGTRYADLNNAFVYRKRIVPDCTCNGRDVFGLAPIDINADPTLRAGDIVATNGARVVLEGRSSKYRADSTPIIDHSRPTRDLSLHLASQKALSANQQ